MREFKDEKTQDWISISQVFFKYYFLVKSQVVSFSCWLKSKWKLRNSISKKKLVKLKFNLGFFHPWIPSALSGALLNDRKPTSLNRVWPLNQFSAFTNWFPASRSCTKAKELLKISAKQSINSQRNLSSGIKATSLINSNTLSLNKSWLIFLKTTMVQEIQVNLFKTHFVVKIEEINFENCCFMVNFYLCQR